MMDVDYIKKRVEDIRECAGDDEIAHDMEDKLHQDVLRQLSKDSNNCMELASEALKTLGIEFNRWTA